MLDPILDIPIYRLPANDWCTERVRRLGDHRRRYLDTHAEDPDNPTALEAETAERVATSMVQGGSLLDGSRLDWDLNEIVGWIRLIHDGAGPVIKGYSWSAQRRTSTGVLRRYQRLGAGFRPQGFVGGIAHKLIEERFDDDDTDSGICLRLRSAVAKQVLTVRRRQGWGSQAAADLRSFDALAPYVGWRRLLNLDH